LLIPKFYYFVKVILEKTLSGVLDLFGVVGSGEEDDLYPSISSPRLLFRIKENVLEFLETNESRGCSLAELLNDEPDVETVMEGGCLDSARSLTNSKAKFFSNAIVSKKYHSSFHYGMVSWYVEPTLRAMVNIE
jgi:hypothetical protein